jgi:hypothetical protein
VKYQCKGHAERVVFRGGIISITNRTLHGEDLLGAFKSRVHVLNYDPSDAQLGALMLRAAESGWPPEMPTIQPAEAQTVAEFVITELLRLGARFDLRLFFNKALPDYQQWKDDEAESDWRDLITASIEEQLVAVRHPSEAGSRAERKDDEHALVEKLLRECPIREDRIRAWVQRTGKSERAYYRRLAEIR